MSRRRSRPFTPGIVRSNTTTSQSTERTPAKREHFLETGDLDTSYLADGIGRFRVSVFRQRGSISAAFRFVPKEIPSFERLGMPEGVAKLEPGDKVEVEVDGLGVLMNTASGQG